MCEINYSTQTVTVKTKYVLSEINSNLSGLPNKQNLSVSKKVNTNGDRYLYVGYGNCIYLIIINFENETATYSANVNAGRQVKELICNPVYPNKCCIGLYINDYIQNIQIVTYSNSTLAITSSDMKKNVYPAYNSYQMHISADGTLLSLAGEYVSNSSTGPEYDPYLILLENGNIKTLTQTSRPGGSCAGINPSGTKYYVYDKIYSITKTSNSVSLTQVGTMTSTDEYIQYGIDFIDDFTMVICNTSSAKIYKLDESGLNPTLIDTVYCSVPSNTISYSSKMLLGQQTGISYIGYASTSTLDTLTTSLGNTLYNTSLANNITPSDVLNTKKYYDQSGYHTGEMPNNGALSYTPTMTQQSIPAGYTSGGTVSSIENTTNYSNWLDKASDIIGNEIDYELEYIESNGNTTQVNTDIIVNEVTDSVIIDVSNPSLQTWEYLIQYNQTRLAAYSTSVSVLWHQNTRTDVSMNLVSSNKYTLNFSNGSISLNGVSKLTWTPATTETTQSGMILFPKLDTASYFRIYEVKVVRSGEIIHDLVPVLHKVNNEYKPCFYDKNTGSYYYNSLNGTLKYKFNSDSYLDYKLDYIKDDLDENLLAGNIKSGVTILGVTGTYTGEEESSE